jgi:light-regulated signal transduction histidine kinase (bacteriophytochrome)
VAVFNELLQEKFRNNMDEEAEELIQHTVDAAHRMEALLRDLLGYTQVDDAPTHIARTDANEVCRNTIAIFEEQIAQSQAHIDCEPLPLLDVHEGHLTQLFQNLIGNALKYRGEEPPRIRVSAERAGELWRISIEDNGIGIHPDYQKQIFGLFKRLHGGGKYSGSGIGLAICQKIVRRYGGRIWVESEVGRGSRFMFTLPGETA